MGSCPPGEKLLKREPIRLKKVRVHNLKQVDLTIPVHELVVFTGVSGSGKSSLAFDTVYVEGQRRYIESLSHHARRYMGDLPKPDAESIEGVSPSIAIDQKTAGKTPRSTVGTMTQIYDFLRVLYARVGIPHCPVSGEPVQTQSREKIIRTVQALENGTKIIVLSPYVQNKKGELKDVFAELLQKGFIHIRLDGEFVDISEVESVAKSQSHTVDIVIDRIVVNPESRSRIAEAVSSALEFGEGVFDLYYPETKEEKTFSQHAFSKKSGLSYGPLEPHDFSFNHPSGMCPKCQGLGRVSEFDLEKIIDPELSISEDCCQIAGNYETVRYGNIYRNLARIYDFKVTTPWKKLDQEAKDVFLNGSDKKWLRMTFHHPKKNTRWTDYVRWKGVLFEAHTKLNEAKSDLYRKKMEKLMTDMVCPECKGSRIRPYPAATKVHNKTLPALTSMPLADALEFFRKMKLSATEQQIANELFKEITKRLEFLVYVGTGYLSLDRIAPTLSGGESQRVRLASQIGSGLVGTTYVLDEPSIGLHPKDHGQLLNSLKKLAEQGNSVLVVEHDRETIEEADTVIEIGPGAGVEGGQIIAQGTVEELKNDPNSITGAYLTGKKKITRPATKRSLVKKGLKICGASHHNLKDVTVDIPLEGLICVTGVSGSGKSSLISDILYPALANHFHSAEHKIGAVKKVEGFEHIDKVIAVDQSPIGRTPRSNPGTYIKLFDDIRALFENLPESRMRGYKRGHFSFNVKEGSCSYCRGMGQVKIDMDFMEDAWVECLQCRGKRFDPEILSVRFNEKNIYEVLEMDVREALQHFSEIPHIAKKLKLLNKVGLGYLKIGQSSSTLSGGEAQRIKLAKELVRPDTGKTLYILDEPTTGLHFEDIGRLIAVLHELVDHKNTVLVIEHNMDFVLTADWIIDIGPGAGIYGGTVVATGTPEQIRKKKTATGLALEQEMHPSKPKKSKTKALVTTEITVEEAKQNNLQSVNLTIPRNQITVFTGPSGSGKTSMAFETIYAEGQRRYIESLSAYARQFVNLLDKPKVGSIDGLSPSIAIEQKKGAVNPRSTVGTLTEIYDLLRILYAHLGVAYCPESGEKIQTISKEFVVNKVLQLPSQEKIQVLAPIEFHKQESFEELQKRLIRQGYLRIRINETYYELDEEIPFEKHRKNELFLVIDRMMVNQEIEKRLYEAVQTATTESNGLVVIARPKEDLFFNLAFAVESTGKSYRPITPQTFSFNSEQGMCLECQGIGSVFGINLLDQPTVLRSSILDTCRRLMKKKASAKSMKLIALYFEKIGIDPYVSVKQLSEKEQDIFLNGTSKKVKEKSLVFGWKGLQPMLADLAKIGSFAHRYTLKPLMHDATCSHCRGERLNPLARGVKVAGVCLPELCSMNIEKALQFIEKLNLTSNHKEFLQETKKQILKSLTFLIEIGLGYLSMNRSAPTLSGGELQRIRLARQLGSGLTSCIYVLDEPTIGLHPYNNHLLNKALKKLRDLNNTLILVEHDPLTIREADYLVDFGPGAGRLGGQITAQGTYEEICKNPDSLTGQYLSGKKSIGIPDTPRKFKPALRVQGGKLHNLKDITVDFGEGILQCITGVSGSGKSTLLHQIIGTAFDKYIQGKQKQNELTVHGATVTGLKRFDKVISIDQNPIGTTVRADVATYTEVLTPIRSFFSSLPLARAKGLQPRNFSYNHKQGMCKTCWGLGYKVIDLQFMPAVKVECESCLGFKLNPMSLEVTYHSKHLGQVLDLTIDEALLFFSEIPKIRRKLEMIIQVGLGYLKLGQEIQTLSGGEAQRIRLSRELSKRSTGKTMYLIDEPTTGLHFEDISKLIQIFHQLVDKKNTIILIEHNQEVIANADWVVDLGPEAGDAGGQVVAVGEPKKITRMRKSHTGHFLKELF